MPRQRSAGAGRAPARPTVPARTSTHPQSQQQTRPAATYAAPATQAPHQPPPTAQAPASSGGSGLFGQMASTAAGVAVGHTVANGIMGMFGGSSSSEAAEASPQAAAPQQQNSYYANQQADPNCAMATKSFTSCMDEHQGNMSICGWYMEQLKACQAAASKY
ncbi:putative Mic17, mitochondrial intermembrane space cysteine motif protein [Cryphonectria parasitica EP155]|uniref:Mic17, mitochondrial intermembrane space cysteine motif protein n=1 Tax=Cryphonectria parasitica (strain ATCC 38755 / EP155) TaxID=660469 RepID=A0A9P5CPE6_CRYP1|nr:putative Mic17, mitochondrial intermembrane space cysteine motif protein [Cryphonectria parasitica EP155]KAF3765081.1 putative Mic17, mitochondrial intermembrane space cysteine motif protein [Cryphonectria parasitica EP155]